MQPMKQYELPDGRALRPLPAALSVSTVVDIRNVEHEITEFMVRRACDEMDAEQQYPFTGRKQKKQRA